jgi:hemolysin D
VSAPSERVPIAIRLASALFEIQAGEPRRRSRIVLWTVCALFGVLLIWATFAKVDIVAVAHGRLVPQTYVKIAQPAEAGVIREILVEEGDSVRQGQVLIRLDPTLNATDSEAISRELALERLQLRRIEAELAGREMERTATDDAHLFAQVDAQRVSHRRAFLDSIAQETAARERAAKDGEAAQEVLKKLAATVPSYLKTADAYQRLASDNLVGSIQAEEHRREAIEKAQDLEAQRATVASLRANLSQMDQRIAQLRSSYESDLNQRRLQSVTTVIRLEQQLGKLRYQHGLLELRASQAGIVKDVATTTLGAVVQPGTVLVSLVPHAEPLFAEVLIENKDIGFVQLRQTVRVKLAAYPFQKYGMLEGIVKTVSADASPVGSADSQRRDPRSVEDATSALGFKALVQLRDQQLRTEMVDLPLIAGMQVSAEIMQGKRTVLEYLLSPVQKVSSEAVTER